MSAISMSAPVAPAVTPAGGTAQAGDAGAEPGEFASLMAGLLGEGAAPAAGEAPADPAAEPVVPEVADGVVDPALAALAAAAQAAPGTVAAVTTVPTTATGPAGASAPTGRPGPVPAQGEVTRTYGGTTGVLVKGTQLPAVPGQADTTGVPGQPVQAVLGAGTPSAAFPAAPATPPAGAPTAEPLPTPVPGDLAAADAAVDLSGLPAGTRPTESAPVAAAQPGVPAVPLSAPAPTAPLAAPAAAAPVHAGPSHVPDQVTAQVFPEIGKLAVRATSAGEGVHRITLNLHPETLGDVRVTLTVRGGEMKVSIHAATEAGRIMADSLPELRRLLASAGAGEASLAVRDSSAGGATMSSADQGSERSGLGRSGYDADHQGRDAHGQDARTRPGLHATDGTNRGPRGVIPGPHDPARATRPAGVDVTV